MHFRNKHHGHGGNRYLRLKVNHPTGQLFTIVSVCLHHMDDRFDDINQSQFYYLHSSVQTTTTTTKRSVYSEHKKELVNHFMNLYLA